MSEFNLNRYSRQMLYPGIGEDGQKRLLNSKVVVIGCGALGTVSASILARAGIGHLTVCDRDFVELSNLQRQVLFDEQDYRETMPKAAAAERKLKQINSEIEIKGIVTDINYTNIEELIQDADLVVDGADNFETRFLVNDACVKHKKPWVYGAAVSSYGLTMTVIPEETPCLRCIFETAPPPGMTPTCDTAGVLSPIINIVSSFQCTEAIKILTGNKAAINRELLSIDVWENHWHRLKIKGRREMSDCPCCIHKKFDYLKADASSQTTTLCGRNSVQISFARKHAQNFDELAERWAKHGTVTRNPFLIRGNIPPYEITIFKDGRAIIQGTKDPTTAKNVYAKYVGA